MALFTIGCWNINSIRTREERLLNWLSKRQPDVVCLQETKTTDDKFPTEGLREAGYGLELFGQKSYNGVALLSTHSFGSVRRGLNEELDRQQARLIGGTVEGLQIYSAYVPNGSAPDSDKYQYKRDWLRGLLELLQEQHDPAEPLLLCGDFNICRDARDVHDQQRWEGTVMFNDEMRGMLQAFLDWGLVDTFRQHNDEAEKFSWWDYRQLAFPFNRGLRIDYILATQPLAERCTGSYIDREFRKGKKPSDHAPIIAEFELD